MIFLCTENLYPIHDSDSPSHRKMYTGLLVRCHLHLIGLRVLPLNLTYILKLRHFSEWTCPIHTSDVPSSESQVHFLALRWFIQEISPCLRLLMNFCNKFIFLWWVVILVPNSKLEDHPLSDVRNCLFSIFAATLHIWRPSPPSTTWGRTMPWWQGTHLTWNFAI
jgi:hypothetical protein